MSESNPTLDIPAERAAFEAWCQDQGFDAGLWIKGSPQCGYDNPRVMDYWEGWRARAAAPQPAGEALTVARFVELCKKHNMAPGQGPTWGDMERLAAEVIAADAARIAALEQHIADQGAVVSIMGRNNEALQAEVERLRAALQFYADGHHFILADESAWDTVSGEPQNFYCDEADTATVEDGSVAKQALAAGTDWIEGEPPAEVEVAWLTLTGPDGEGGDAARVLLCVRGEDPYGTEAWCEAGDWKGESRLDSIHEGHTAITAWMPYAVPKAPAVTS